MILGLVALARGDLVAAHEHLVVALRARIANGFHSAAGETLHAMGVRCALGGDLRPAARLFGAAQAARARLRTPAGSATGRPVSRSVLGRARGGGASRAG